jgi:hypothetical protein
MENALKTKSQRLYYQARIFEAFGKPVAAAQTRRQAALYEAFGQ